MNKVCPRHATPQASSRGSREQTHVTAVGRLPTPGAPTLQQGTLERGAPHGRSVDKAVFSSSADLSRAQILRVREGRDKNEFQPVPAFKGITGRLKNNYRAV